MNLFVKRINVNCIISQVQGIQVAGTLWAPTFLDLLATYFPEIAYPVNIDDQTIKDIILETVALPDGYDKDIYVAARLQYRNTLSISDGIPLNMPYIVDFFRSCFGIIVK